MQMGAGCPWHHDSMRDDPPDGCAKDARKNNGLESRNRRGIRKFPQYSNNSLP